MIALARMRSFFGARCFLKPTKAGRIAVGLLSCLLIASPARPGQPVALAQVTDSRINEASGIAASRLNPGCYYIHNDSGCAPCVYLIDRAGCVLLEIRLNGVEARDCEDIALAPGERPGVFDVCVADIGDNKARRRNVSIYRFPEPPLPQRDKTASGPAQTPAVIQVHPTRYTLRYANGPADAEAFCVHPRTGDGYILTKRIDGRSIVYKLPAPWNQNEQTLRELCTVELPMAMIGLSRIVTAADISPDGRRLAVRCYVNGWEWRLPAGANDQSFDRSFTVKPMQLNLPSELQGEALCYSLDGATFLTISEGWSPTLWETPAPAP